MKSGDIVYPVCFPVDGERLEKLLNENIKGGRIKIMNEPEWKELDLNNPPEKILIKGVYDVQSFVFGRWTNDTDFDGSVKIGMKYRYRKRKPEKTEPSHEEIMTKWWKIGDGWWHIAAYEAVQSGCSYYIKSVWQKRDWFIGRESADMPPEE